MGNLGFQEAVVVGGTIGSVLAAAWWLRLVSFKVKE